MGLLVLILEDPVMTRMFSSRYVYSSKKEDQTEEPKRPTKFF